MEQFGHPHRGGGGGGRSTPYNSLYGEASPEKGIFFKPRVEGEGRDFTF